MRRRSSDLSLILLFLLPSLAGFLFFNGLPILGSLGLSLTEWDVLTPPRFVGMANYLRLLRDPSFWHALRNTLYFVAGYIPLVMAGGLALALLLNQSVKGLAFFRAAFFLPVISSWVAVALLWTWIFNPRYGLANNLLGLVGIEGPAWLYDPAWAMPAVIITTAWKDLGFAMVLFLAGLQGIPREHYEAAAVDGAGRLQTFFRVTIPLLSPTTFFVLTISLINNFQVFDQVWIMTEGGPYGSTSVLVEQIYRNAFRYGRMGYASAISWVLFAVVFATSALQLRLQRRWVTYG